MWINVKDSLPEEGTLVIASNGLAWGFALFEDGDFCFEDWVMGVPTGDIIEWMVPVPSNSQESGSEKTSPNTTNTAIALLDEFIEVYESCGISLELAEFYDKVCEWKK